MPEIHDALARAVATRPARRRWHPSRRAGLLTVGALAVSGSALAATGGWRPILGDNDRGRPHAAHTTIPAPQIAALSVLRRAQTDRDRRPEVLSILRLLSSAGINGVHTDGIRVLRERQGGVTILVPAERAGGDRNPRRQMLCVLTTVTATHGATVKNRAPSKLRTIPRLGGVGQVCGDLRQLRTTGIGASGTRTQNGWITGALVPDGVAHVVIRLRNNRDLTVAVRNNYYEINSGNELAPAWGARWLNAQGRTIDPSRTTTRRP